MDIIKTAAILLAAGDSTRFKVPKLFVKVMGKPVLQYTYDSFKDFVDYTVVVSKSYTRLLGNPNGRIGYTTGGDNRFESIKAGFKALEPIYRNILIVDGSRCHTKERIVNDLLKELKNNHCVCPAIPVINPRCAIRDGQVYQFYDKNDACDLHTPIAIRRRILKKCLKYGIPYFGFYIPLIAYQLGYNVQVITSEADNIKLDYPDDYKLFEYYLRSENGV